MGQPPVKFEATENIRYYQSCSTSPHLIISTPTTASVTSEVVFAREKNLEEG